MKKNVFWNVFFRPWDNFCWLLLILCRRLWTWPFLWTTLPLLWTSSTSSTSSRESDTTRSVILVHNTIIQEQSKPVLTYFRSIWKLDLCTTVLPQIDKLLQSKYESYMQTGCTSLKLIMRHFWALISDTLKATPSVGVDITREERHQKCRACCKQLKNLSNIVKNKASYVGRHGSAFKELQLLMAPLDDSLWDETDQFKSEEGQTTLSGKPTGESHSQTWYLKTWCFLAKRKRGVLLGPLWLMMCLLQLVLALKKVKQVLIIDLNPQTRQYLCLRKAITLNSE